MNERGAKFVHASESGPRLGIRPATAELEQSFWCRRKVQPPNWRSLKGAAFMLAYTPSISLKATATLTWSGYHTPRCKVKV